MVRSLAAALSISNLGQVVHTCVPLLPSSIICTNKSWGVNRHTMWCTSPIAVVWQHKLVSGWRLQKWRSAPPHGPRWLELYVFTVVFDVLEKQELIQQMQKSHVMRVVGRMLCKTLHFSILDRSSSVKFGITGYCNLCWLWHVGSQDTNLSCCLPISTFCCTISESQSINVTDR